jgi:hypothetical protein
MTWKNHRNTLVLLVTAVKEFVEFACYLIQPQSPSISCYVVRLESITHSAFIPQQIKDYAVGIPTYLAKNQKEYSNYC